MCTRVRRHLYQHIFYNLTNYLFHHIEAINTVQVLLYLLYSVYIVYTGYISPVAMVFADREVFECRAFLPFS